MGDVKKKDSIIWATGWMIGGSSAGRGWEFFSSLPHPDRLWYHPDSYPMGTRGSFPGSKAAGARNWPLTSISCRGQECVVLYLLSPSSLNGMVLN